MPTLTQTIEARARAFAIDITALVQEALVEALKVPAPAATKPRRSAAPALAPGEKRTPEQLEKLGDAFVVHVTKFPGKGIEDIAKQMGVTTRELNLPVRKALEDGAVTSEGIKRATKYFPRKVG